MDNTSYKTQKYLSKYRSATNASDKQKYLKHLSKYSQIGGALEGLDKLEQTLNELTKEDDDNIINKIKTKIEDLKTKKENLQNNLNEQLSKQETNENEINLANTKIKELNNKVNEYKKDLSSLFELAN